MYLVIKRLFAKGGWGLILPILLMTMASQSAIARGAPDSFADLVEKLLPAVVNISTTQQIRRSAQQRFELPPGSPFEDFFKDFFERGQGSQPMPITSLGSGFVIDPSGIIVTNNHVIAGADKITINLANGTSLKAEVIGHDSKTDIAVLKIQPKTPLLFVSWGNSRKVRVGDWVVAIGNPFGLGGSVTAGIVSAKGRDIKVGPYTDFIQTDASINKGNSGGPLFNIDGEVIGINTAIYSPNGVSVGIGFSITSEIAQHVVLQLQEFGRTRRGWLGVRIQQVTDEIAQSLGLQEAQGVLVASLTKEGPADVAGLKKGDVILFLDDKPVRAMRDLQRIVAETMVGAEVGVAVWRKKRRQQIKVTLGELELAEESGALDTDFRGDVPDEKEKGIEFILGMSLARLDNGLRTRFKIPQSSVGVVVTSVADNGAALAKGIATGDVIVEINQESVATPNDVQNLIRKARRNGKKTILVLLERNGEPRFSALRIEE